MFKVGDLVRYESSEEKGVYRLGHVTDVMPEVNEGWDMYEVICSDPYERGWFMDVELKVINESR